MQQLQQQQLEQLQLQQQQLEQLQQSQQLQQQQLVQLQLQRQWYSYPDSINFTDSTKLNKTVPGTTLINDALAGSLQSLQQSQQLQQQQLVQFEQSQQLQQQQLVQMQQSQQLVLQQLVQLQRSLGLLQSIVTPSTNTSAMAVGPVITPTGQNTTNEKQGQQGSLQVEPLQVPTPPPPPIQTPTPTPPPPPIQTPTPTPPPPPIQTPTPTPPPPPIQTPTPTSAPKLAANGTAVQNSAVSELKPINENAGGNFLDVVAINASREQVPENVAVNVLDTNQSTRWSGEGNGYLDSS